MTATDMTVFDRSERNAWSGRADAYAATFGKLCAYPVPDLLDAAEVRSGTRLLDVGTGPGTAAAVAYRRGAMVTAVDAEPSMVVRAARLVPAADVRLATLPELPFGDDEFDAVVANFVLNHVGQPLVTLTELRRVTRPGGRIAVTIWPAEAAPGQTLLGRAVQTAGVTRPADLPALAGADDFPRTEQGLLEILGAAGLTGTSCRTLAWDHHSTVEEWWSGPAAGIATIGQIVTRQSPEVAARIRDRYEALSAELTRPDGTLALPHTALLAYGRA